MASHTSDDRFFSNLSPLTGNSTLESTLPLSSNDDVSDQSTKKKHKKKKSMNWTLDDQIKLLETRKEMNDVFMTKYQTGDAWLELVKKCGWDIEWEVARNKFMYIKRREGPKRSNAPPTGIAGDFEDGSKKSRLYELATYFTIRSHKYNFPRVIDTSAFDPFSMNSSTQIIPDNDVLDLTSNDTSQNQENQNPPISPISPNPSFSPIYNWDDDNNNTDDPFPEPEAPDKSSQTSTSSKSSNNATVTNDKKSSPSLYHRKRRKNMTQNDIMMKTSESIEKMANDLSKLTSGTLEYLNFSKELKLKTFKKKYETVDLTDES
ncbi:uncharacterized protein LOC107363023 [Tetranychus urticae]|uniref:uncharacterized protein LOC107363023 n=1 Tax=Tetranychus urticae TaxID=32264 RepID=UPI00077BA6B2|nr:uncharacterized protein LOC107363023 [Tetranychus urticae]